MGYSRGEIAELLDVMNRLQVLRQSEVRSPLHPVKFAWNGLGAACDDTRWPWPRFTVRERHFDWERDT